ncbi:short-chain dehydrogenase/reductase SDR [Psychromonas ingrahamii 37]|uniref:Short-chain dehydrogenase/reductase SDR n=1 Tax=Psychromonas ingrahamii (strain DSM 17664 / CCUG 51855 / 37) TaxID=357804 RepID=A1SWI7_PSYIN|nr:SDR family NAD(P)-dependent oxidoreductase [Psychromonas ingrahamii]ABM03852.1 short-chain dehydrogenase/reductase SDR [Psychromonas ingrahamii 37]
MKKTILITGATDGIGLATAKMLASNGHSLLVHGRNPEKLNKVVKMLTELPNAGTVKSYLADLSQMSDVKTLANKIKAQYDNLDVLINNAGVFKVDNPITRDGLDLRFTVNTIAPYLLLQELLPLLATSARVINLSSAAQAPVNMQALLGKVPLSDMEAYAQSKLAITMWSRIMAQTLKDKGPVIITVNPGSMLGSKMVQEGFGVAGGDLKIGAKILTRLALDKEFAGSSGQYFDNDAGRFCSPHPDGLNLQKSAELVTTIESILSGIKH